MIGVVLHETALYEELTVSMLMKTPRRAASW